LGVQVDPTQSYLSLRLNAPPDNLGGFISASESPTGYASNWPEYFLIGPAPPTVNWIQYNPGSSYIGQISVAPDVWHHLLVSYDVSGGTVGSCWIALDGRDYPMNNYGWPSGVGPTLDSGSSYSGLGPNEIVAGFQMFADDPDVAMTPGFSLDPGPYIGLTSPNNELSLHTSTVDVAELYIWSGMTLTSEDASLFISSTGTPAPPASLPFPLPDIRIHGSQAWIKGNNSGHLIGDFTPFGELLIIKPDPQIGT